MPILGADMTAGTLIEWRKQPGDRLQRGDIIAEVETEKGLIEVEVFTTGVLEKILVEPGRQVPVGTPLAIIRDEGGAAPQAAPPRITPAPEGMRLRISPAAKKLAQELGVDVAGLRGTGAGGAITIEDVKQAASAAAPAAPADRFARMRQTIAMAMARSKREIPHYYLSTTIDMHRAMVWTAETNRTRSVADRLLYSVLCIKAVALALREVPDLNATWDGTQAVRSGAIHVGVAVSLRQGGLVAPAIHDTDRQSLGELMRQLRDLVGRARAGTLRSSEVSDPTITVTNIGEQGVETVFGIIYPPQVALVGFGKLVERPCSVDGQIVSHPVLNATLSGDHRVTDGHQGARFLAAVDRLLQEPSQL